MSYSHYKSKVETLTRIVGFSQNDPLDFDIIFDLHVVVG